MPRVSSKHAALAGRRRRSATGRGFVLSQGRPEAAAAWGRRGLGPVLIGALEGWTVVVPDGQPKARFPYDDAVRTLAGRPVGLRMRPSLGFFQVGRQAVVTVHPQAWRAVERWAAWTPRDGLVPLPGLPTAHPLDLVEAAGLPPERQARAAANLHEIFANGGLSAPEVLAAVLLELGLPGRELLAGELAPSDLPGVRRVTPRDRHARSFDRLVLEERRWAEEEAK